MTRRAPSGPLVGVRVLEFAGHGPTPFVAMLMSDMGAEVLRVERPGRTGKRRVPLRFPPAGTGRLR